MLLKIILEGIGLGMILVLCCTVGMRHLYHRDVQERCIKMGLITKEQISKRSKLMKSVMLSVYLFYLLLAVYVVNGSGDFVSAALQCFAILSILNLVDRILVDELWVGHTKAWMIPGTEDLKPYIKKQDLNDTDRSFLDDLLLWSPSLPANCRKPDKSEVMFPFK